MNSERRKDCPMRHPDNGNCLPAGGFCTAVNNIICDALHSAHMRGYVAASEKYTEVVRCKDCKYCMMCYPEKQIDKEATPGWYCKDQKKYRRPDDFCSYGERKYNGSNI